uniref:Basement membrane-specific heparan sulfate proteoglycan core protein n=1 Tax=Anopheles dirus TaxID=7168 RepID=A0A182NMM7_9DIPT
VAPRVNPLNKNYVVVQGTDFSLSCEATGTPFPTIKWTLSGKPFESNVQQSGNVLRIFNAQPSNGGVYICVANNEESMDRAYTVVEIDRREKPTLEIYPNEPQTIKVGESRGDVGGHDDDYNEPPQRPQTSRPPVDNRQPVAHTYKAILGEQSQLMCKEQYQSARTEWRRSDGRTLPYGSIVRGGNLTIENTGYDAYGMYDCITYPPSGAPVTVVRIMVEVVAPPKITFSPPMPMTVRSGDKVDIFCNITGDQPIQYRWHGENGRSLPPSVQVYDNYLSFYSIAPEDAGRYYCTASNQYGNTTKVAEVLVNRNDLRPAPPIHGQRDHQVVQGSSIRLECKPPHGMPYVAVHYNWTRLERPLPQGARVHDKELRLYNVRREDAGTYECSMTYPNGSIAYDSVVLTIMAPESLPVLQLVPSRSLVRPGESLEVDCSSSAGTNVPIRWEKADGMNLPYNIRQEGNRLYIQNAREDDSGTYTCVCYTEDGLRYITDFQLEVEENTIPDVLPRSTSRLEFAERGTTVKLQCNTDLYPTSYHWTRVDGEIPTDRDTRGSPRSYMAFKSFDNVYSKFYFEISFKPEKMNGLILYNSQRRQKQDYIALSLHNGYPQFRFNFDGQYTMLQPEKPVRMGEWHTVKVNRVRNNGFLLVDDQAPVNFPEKLKFYGLNLDDNLFIGGVASFDQVPELAVDAREGFVGCISRLKLNDREVQLYEDALETVGITTCEPCADDPCSNAGTCLEAQTAQGYSCLCREGFTGKNCQREGEGCGVDTCGVGRCEETETGPECYCPVHKTGERCQYTEHYTDATLAFKDGSYAAYDKFQSKRSIRFRFKPDSTENGILFYAAEHEQAYGDFMAVILNNGFVELRYSVAGKMRPMIVRSIVPVEVGQWHMVSAGRSKAGIGYLQVDDEAVINEMNNRNIPILLKTKVYAGGYDKRLLLNQEIGVRRGFEGCIAELEISGNKLNMIEDIRDSANVYHCGHAGAPQPDPNEDEQAVTCRPGRDGYDCDIVTDICLDQRPCENGAQCHPHPGGQNYTCTCQPGYLGLRCETQYNTIVASRFHGNGFIEINPEAFQQGGNQETTELAIMFSAYELNGLLIWYGQRNGEEFLGHDYIALAVQNGFVELTIRMDGQESYVRNSDVFVVDNERHVALIRRERNQFHLQVDSLTVHGETRPTGKQTIDIPGSIYVGGVPDIDRVTGNRYNESFNGCVFSVENIAQSKSIELRDYAIRTVNVDVCDEPNLGTEPPVV